MGLEVRAISDKHNIKIAIVDLTDGFKEIVKLQKPNMIAATALGKTLANTTLMSLSIKEGVLTLQLTEWDFVEMWSLNLITTHSEGTSKTHDLTPMILQPKKVIQVRYRKR
jgi:hypothetical protein